MRSNETPLIGLMLDIETLGTGPNAVVTQTALFGWDLMDPETLLPLPHFRYLPVPPQLELPQPRVMDFQTILWTIKTHGKEAADSLANNDSQDIDELTSNLRHFNRAFMRMTDNGNIPYELWTRGMFDTVILKSLMLAVGFEAPWEFWRERDLRTLESVSGVPYHDIPMDVGHIPHQADWDCRRQIQHHTACMKALHRD